MAGDVLTFLVCFAFDMQCAAKCNVVQQLPKREAREDKIDHQSSQSHIRLICREETCVSDRRTDGYVIISALGIWRKENLEKEDVLSL